MRIIPVLQIRIRIHVLLGLLDPNPDPLVRVIRIRMFLGLLYTDPYPAVTGMDPDPSFIKQKLVSRIRKRTKMAWICLTGSNYGTTIYKYYYLRVSSSFPLC
jgi:hypothetical protein